MGRRREPFIYKPRTTETCIQNKRSAPKGESRKSRVKETYLVHGRQAAIDHALRLGVKIDSVRSWCHRWSKGKENKPTPQLRISRVVPPASSVDPSCSPSRAVVEALFAEFGGSDKRARLWVRESVKHFEDVEREKDGKSTARDDALAWIAAAAIYLVKIYGSRLTFEAMQRMTDQLVDEAGVLTTEEQ